MTLLLLLFSGVVNVTLAVVIFISFREIEKLEKKLNYTETCLKRADENNRRMLQAIDEANRNI